MSFECKTCKKDFEKGFFIKEGGWALMEICKDCKEKYPSKAKFFKLESTEDLLKEIL